MYIRRGVSSHDDDVSIVVPPESNRGNDVVEPYVAAVLRVAARVGAAVLDVHRLMREEEDWRRYLGDGLHLSDAGNDFVFRELMKLIDKQWPALSPALMPPEFPEHTTIDAQNPEKSLGGVGSWLK